MGDVASIEHSQTTELTPTPARWWWAVLAGSILAIPLGWLLSYGASLLTYLGLFFFMLFGLVIGAAMFRIGHPLRPIATWKIRLGTTLAVLVGWGVSMAVECYEFPSDVAERVLKPETRVFRYRPGGMTPDDIKQQAMKWVRAYLRENYPPGGAIGYMRWKLGNDRLAVKIEGLPAPVRLRFDDNGGWWAARVFLSIFLFAFAIQAVVRPLSKPEEKLGASDPAPTT